MKIYITTAIAYSNGPPHLGHAMEYLAADAYARHWRRRLGRENVTLVTGTDEHGQKNRDAALADGLSPKAFADKISALFRATHDGLSVSYDCFVRTTDPAHKEFVRWMLARINQRGAIAFKEYEGLYCIGCERFYTEKELIDAAICPDHKRPVERFKEPNYFLKLEPHRERLRAHIREHPRFIRPERYRNEALRMLEEPLDDLCISRPKSRLDWGIDLPFDDKYVTYVWFDAFWAYLSKLPDAGVQELASILPVTEHFIGKDILKTHAIYWPAMLWSLDLPVYRSLNVHGWMNYATARFSKSSGNILDPLQYVQRYAPDVLRYFVLREATYGLDLDFTEERLVERYNSDLANDLGNLISRVLAMVARYLGGEMTAAPTGATDPADDSFVQRFVMFASGELIGERIERLEFNRALEAIWQALDAVNKYVVATSPFTLARDPANMPRVAQIMANLLEALRVIADLLAPVMPVTSARMLDLLGVDEATARQPFGQGLRPGHRVKPAVALFPRIERKRA